MIGNLEKIGSVNIRNYGKSTETPKNDKNTGTNELELSSYRNIPCYMSRVTFKALPAPITENLETVKNADKNQQVTEFAKELLLSEDKYQLTKKLYNAIRNEGEGEYDTNVRKFAVNFLDENIDSVNARHILINAIKVTTNSELHCHIIDTLAKYIDKKQVKEGFGQIIIYPNNGYLNKAKERIIEVYRSNMSDAKAEEFQGIILGNIDTGNDELRLTIINDLKERYSDPNTKSPGNGIQNDAIMAFRDTKNNDLKEAILDFAGCFKSLLAAKFLNKIVNDWPEEQSIKSKAADILKEKYGIN